MYNLALSFAQKHLSLIVCRSAGGCFVGGWSVKVGQVKVDSKVMYSH